MFAEIQDSEIIKNIIAANKVHPYHNDENFKKYRHFVFPFHDTTLEVIAKVYEFEQPVKPESSFSKTTKPNSRKADFFLGRLRRNAFIEADKYKWSKEELKAYDNVGIKEQDERGEREKAATDAIIKVAKKLKAMGLSNEDIEEATGLSDNEINRI
jgi:hypothetical protein